MTTLDLRITRRPAPRPRALRAGMLCLLVAGPALAAADLPPAAELLIRRQKLAPGDVDGHLSLARWCQDHRLLQQAADLYDKVLDLDAEHDVAYRELVRIRDTTRLPEDSARQQRLKEKFGKDFELFVTPHYLIFYRADEQWMRSRAALMEKAHDVFYSTFRRYDYRAMPLAERLVCVLFADHEDYAAYALQYDGVKVGWMTGYYSRRTNVIQFYDDRTSPQFQPVIERVGQLERANDQLIESMQEARRQRNHAVSLELQRQQKQLLRELTWYRNRHEAIARIGDTAKTVHEAVHQLAFNSGLHRRDRAYPFWLLEGLATNFETDDPAKPFGPLHESEFRPRQARKLLETDSLLDLKTFLLIEHAPTDERLAHVAYTEAFALFRYLFRYKNAELRKYLGLLEAAPAGPRDADAMREDFVKSFGPIQPLEQRFLRYIRRLE